MIKSVVQLALARDDLGADLAPRLKELGARL
jgi:hypothetical protein